MLGALQMLTQPANGFLAYRAEDDLLRVETHHRLINTLMILSTLLQREYNALATSFRSDHTG
jgi:two-component sensor histidine kinase